MDGLLEQLEEINRLSARQLHNAIGYLLASIREGLLNGPRPEPDSTPMLPPVSAKIMINTPPWSEQGTS